MQSLLLVMRIELDFIEFIYVSGFLQLQTTIWKRYCSPDFIANPVYHAHPLEIVELDLYRMI